MPIQKIASVRIETVICNAKYHGFKTSPIQTPKQNATQYLVDQDMDKFGEKLFDGWQNHDFRSRQRFVPSIGKAL